MQNIQIHKQKARRHSKDVVIAILQYCQQNKRLELQMQRRTAQDELSGPSMVNWCNGFSGNK
jgi:hypothetical protein